MSYSILFSREILTNYSTHASNLPPQQNSTLHIHVLVGKHPNKVSVKIWHLKKSLVFGKWWLESFFVFSIYFLEENVVGFLVFLLYQGGLLRSFTYKFSAQLKTVAYCSKKRDFLHTFLSARFVHRTSLIPKTLFMNQYSNEFLFKEDFLSWDTPWRLK